MGEIKRQKSGFLGATLGAGRHLIQRGLTAPIFDSLVLAGPHPLRLVAIPPDPWSGDPALGAALLTGRMVHGGAVLKGADSGTDSPERWTPAKLWAATDLAPGWQGWLHGFSWLRDLAAVADRGAAARVAEAHVRAWCDHHEERPSPGWDAATTGRRLLFWISYAPMILSKDDMVFRSRLMTNLARQARHLARSWSASAPGPERIAALVGLAMSGLFLPESDRQRRLSFAALESGLDRLILPDGGIVTRSPADLHQAFRDLLSLEAAVVALGEPCPPAVTQALDRIAPMLKAQLLGDGRLAQFNGTAAEAARVAADLDGPFAAMTPLDNGLHSGYQRLARGPMIVVVDAGPPVKHALSGHHHAGTLSFEMSFGTERLVVNCGSLRPLPDVAAVELAGIRPETLAILARATAAHSTLTVNDTNSSVIQRRGLLGDGPATVEFERAEEGGALLLEASHDGYANRCGLKHQRRIFIDSLGRDLRGADSLRALRPRRRALKFDVRFHLHPDVSVREEVRGETLLLRLPSGQAFRFLAKGGVVNLDDSLYFGTPTAPRPTRQIVITGNVQADETTVQWAFRALGDENGA